MDEIPELRELGTILLKNITNIDKVNCLEDVCKLVKYPQVDILIFANISKILL